MNSNLPKVSIIIPVYNGSNFLREAIDSALAQTYKNIEVIVVNDGSDDGGKTEEVARAYGNRIIYYHKENEGAASAINLGIKKMSGELFSWLSHDDIYSPFKIEKQIDYYSRLQGKSIIFSHSDMINAQGKMVIKGKRINIKECRLYFDILANRFFISGCTLLIPKKAFNEVGYFSSRYHTVQDYEMWFRMINAGYQFKYLPMSAVKSRVHLGQDSKTKLNLFIEEKDSFYISALNSLRRDLWLDHWDNKAIAYFNLAKNYKKGRLRKASCEALQRGKVELLNLPYSGKVLALPYYLSTLLWSKYLSPVFYINKLKLLIGRL